MKILVVYDSVFGNTEQIGRAIAAALTGNDIKVVNVQEFTLTDLQGLEMLVVGGPTQSWTSTVAMNGFIHEIPDGGLAGIRAAAFDTRVGSWLSGSAAPKIGKALQQKGACILGPPRAFFVKGRSGPLVKGEEQRAAEWARELLGASQAK
jgi:flavodoxin